MNEAIEMGKNEKMFLLTSVLFALCIVIPESGFAYNNEIGFYTDMEQSAVHVETDQTLIFDVYVLIHNPYNDSLGLPVESIGGFEFKINLPNSVFLVQMTYPVPATNHSYGWDEIILEYNSPIPVTPETPTLLVTLKFLETAPGDDHNLYLSPVSQPSIPGEIAFLDYTNTAVIPMNNVIGGELSNPIFGINPTEPVVAVDHISFDAVKALYR